MDDTRSSCRPSLWPRQLQEGTVCTQGRHTCLHALTSSQQKSNRPSQSSTPWGKQCEGSCQLGKLISQCCSADRYHLSAPFPLFRTTVRNIHNFWESESNCQSRNRKSRKIVHGAISEDTRDWTQSIRSRDKNITTDTWCALWKEGKDHALRMHQGRASIHRDQLGRLSCPHHIWVELSLLSSNLLRILLVASNRNYNAYFPKAEKRKKKQKEERKRRKKGGKQVGNKEEGRSLIQLKVWNWGQIWDTNHIIRARFVPLPPQF